MSKEQNIFEQAVKEFSQNPIPNGPSQDLIRQTIEKIESEASIPEGPSKELVEQTVERVEQEQHKPNPFMERMYKMKPIIKFAVAAMLIIGIFVAMNFNTSIALADVYQKVQQAQAFMYTMSMTMSGMGEAMGMPGMGGTMTMNMDVTISTEHGIKVTNHTQASGPNGQTEENINFSYLSLDKKLMVLVMPEQKTYQNIELTDGLLKDSQKENNDPRELIKKMLSTEYTELGQSEIDGIEVQGFETSDPALAGGTSEDCTAILWVDVDTWLPVRYEMTSKMGQTMETHCVIDQFRWDVQVSAADFEYIIPDDYTEQEAMTIPKMTEETAIKGLEMYKSLCGNYPEKLDVMTLMKSMIKTMKNPKTEFAQELMKKFEAIELEAEGDPVKIALHSQKLTEPLSHLAAFHMQLVQQKKNPAYYGDQITPDDVDAVLMRWKLDNGTYMVIFGDLSTAEMEYEDLVKIEPKIPAQPAQP